ncbi:cytochrome P450 [Lizonia empirigonia]|nr:cytochrome P450 [Lizonia empirigonia]
MRLAEIPGPPAYPWIGNMLDIDAQNPTLSLCGLTEEYGELWKFHFGGEERLVVAAALRQARNGVHDGLGTAYGPQEKNWGIAHRILAPKLNPLAIRSMFDGIHDVASQLVTKWARHGPGSVIEVNEDLTRLTFDALALCTMNHRFNSYYSQDMHPFLKAITEFLKTSGDRARRVWFVQILCVLENRRYWRNIDLLRKTSLDVVQTRKENPTDQDDLLSGMLAGVDPQTGEKMSDDSVVDNMIIFLIAGHETTSGLLSFTLCYLLQNAAAYAEAQQEVDDVLGGDKITVDHLAKLPFLNAVLRESLRLTPTVPSIIVTPLEDTVLGGKYYVKRGIPIVALPSMVHRDKTVYGEDAADFGQYACSTKHFAAAIRLFPTAGNSLAMAYELLRLSLDDPSYQLRIKQTLTTKPDGFRMRARLREKWAAVRERALGALVGHGGMHIEQTKKISEEASTKVPIHIYYGSRTGTCEALASRLARSVADCGHRVGGLDTLNSGTDALLPDTIVVVIAGSYEGRPAENAVQFVDWVHALKGGSLADVSYAVFGCGDSVYSGTFHKVPRYLDATLEKRGATRIAAMGTADAARSDVLNDFKTWRTTSSGPRCERVATL